MITNQAKEIIQGQKTQTRRIVKDNEIMDAQYSRKISDLIKCVRYHPMGELGGETRNKWQVGRDYAVVPKRGTPQVYYAHDMDTGELVFAHEHHPPIFFEGVRNNKTALELAKSTQENVGSVLRGWGYKPLSIRLTDIRCEPLQDMTEADAIAEGITNISSVSNGAGWYKNYLDDSVMCRPVDSYKSLWESINKRLGTRWQDNPDVWVLEFEAV